MSRNPNLILYACIAKDTTILAEFNSKDTDLSDLAKKCLEKTPLFHSIFSHTANGETYMFFIFDPFVYFGIFNQSLENPNCLLFLKSVKDAFTSMIDNGASGSINQRLNSPNSLCFQREFSPVFHQLLGSSSEAGHRISSPVGLKDYHREGLDSSGWKLQKAMGIWKKQVIAVLSMDLIVCVGLFVIWVWVCKGFHCVAN